MSLSPYDNNPIAERKAAVRRHSKNIQVTGLAGLGVAVLGLIGGGGFSFVLSVILICLVVAGYNGWKINKIINEKDTW